MKSFPGFVHDSITSTIPQTYPETASGAKRKHVIDFLEPSHYPFALRTIGKVLKKQGMKLSAT